MGIDDIVDQRKPSLTDQLKGAVKQSVEQTFGVEIANVDEPTNDQNTYSTGGGPISITENWRDFKLPFEAGTVSIRGEADIDVAFEKPYDRPDRHISVSSEELPFTSGGDSPLNTDVVWVRRAGSATQDPSVQIVAIKGQ